MLLDEENGQTGVEVKRMDNLQTVSQSLFESSASVQRLYPYTRRSGQNTISQMASPKGLVVEGRILTVLRKQGFALNPDRDNKSIYDPLKLFPNLERYGQPSAKGNVDDRVFKQATALTFKAFAKPSSLDPLEVLNLDERLMGSVKGDKSSGAPEFIKKADAFIKDLHRARRIAEKCTNGERASAPPCLAYHRVQHGLEGPKTRLVWGYPQAMTLLESCFARPLIDEFLVNRSPMAFGLQKFELGARLVRIGNLGVNYAIDFSKFDASISPRLISLAFRILRTWFELDASQEAVWDKVVNYFIHTPILMPDGYVWLKHQGVPSGSYFTQLVDSIVNYLVIQYVMLKTTGEAATNCLVLGDDSIFSSSHWIDLTDIAAHAKSLGLIVNVEKSGRFRHDENVSFLGHEWKHSLVDRPVEDVAKRLAFPERWSPEDDSVKRINSRLLGYLSDSVSAWCVIKPMITYKGPIIYGYVSKPMSVEAATGWWEYQFSLNRRLPNSAIFGYWGILM